MSIFVWFAHNAFQIIKIGMNLESSFLFLLAGVWFLIAEGTGLYDEFRSRNFGFEFISLIKTILFFSVTAIVLIFVFDELRIERSFIFYLVAYLSAVLTIEKYLFRKILALIRIKGYNIRQIIIIGAGDVGRKFYNSIAINKHFGYKVLGFLDDHQQNSAEYNYLGKLDELKNIIKNNEVDSVIIALPNYAINKIQKIVQICNREAVRVRLIPDYFSFLSKNYQISSFGEFPIIYVRNEPLEELHYRLLKRAFDIVFSVIAICISYPIVIPIVFIGQLICSPGPLFFIQDRIGRKNKIFRCFKFRTMDANHSKNLAEFKATVRDDPRISKFGRFLRRMNLDELPQFINVLQGNMSVVGPRPHAISFNEKYSEYYDEIKLRHLVKPGITGWAQTHGLRGDNPDEEENRKRTVKRIKYDIWYIENWSFWLDIQIIYLTIWRCLVRDSNAY